MARFKVVGFKRFQGDMDGKSIDSGKLFIEIRLDDSRNGEKQFSKGVFTEELRLPSSEMVRRIEHIPLPAIFDIDTERVGNGRDSREIVLDLRPVDVVKPAPVKAA